MSFNKDIQNSINELGMDIHSINHIAIISTTDIEGRITYVNDNFCMISGYSAQELLGKDHRILNSGLHSKDFFNEMWNCLKSGKTWHGKVRNKSKTGEFYWVYAYNVPVFDDDKNISKFISFRFDITSEKLAEEALAIEKNKSLHLGRLSLIGKIAGGFAHEILNPLTIIDGAVAIIFKKVVDLNQTDEKTKILENIGKIQNQIKRVGVMLDGLRSFSGPDNSHARENVFLEKIFLAVEDLCSDKLKKMNVNLTIQVEESDVELYCNPIQIEQSLLNLINNSIDAVSSMEDKWIRLEGKLIVNVWQISVLDSGHGISEDVAKQIMQPFFSTKDIGKGTGLGLSTTMGIIESHEGKFYLDEKSSNTRFVIELPITRERTRI